VGSQKLLDFSLLGSRQWVAMRPFSLRIHRRKAVSEVSLPGSSHSSPSADDPEETDDVFKSSGSLLIFKLPFAEN
jgi:hypothetical protein